MSDETPGMPVLLPWQQAMLDNALAYAYGVVLVSGRRNGYRERRALQRRLSDAPPP